MEAWTRSHPSSHGSARAFRASSSDLGRMRRRSLPSGVTPVSGAPPGSVTHIIATGSHDWDAQLEQWEGGWPWFFQILRLYLGEFPGQPVSHSAPWAPPRRQADAAWGFAKTLGIAGAEPGAGAAPPELSPMRVASRMSRLGKGLRRRAAAGRSLR